MKKDEMKELYNKLGDTGVDELYYYSCLLESGFNEDVAYDLIGTLNALYLQDESGLTIGVLSDSLYDIYDDIKDNIDTMTDSEILEKIY